ncbi:hypothetical protein MTR67_019082 [Solanum verrucosum]|uniref:DUF4283 domain-containing protein n=1 Tax=Solanum verrucosum TaxID=315347 RepID=A0AAF0QN12_SOLVR|nr:hypothetical protein MTR67_019082 [Solanum verrucosum]
MFDPEKETSRAIAWISFPALPPIFFVKEVVFSLAAAVGKPLQSYIQQGRGVELMMLSERRATEKIREGMITMWKEGNQDKAREKMHSRNRKEKNGGWERKAGQLQVWNPKHRQQGKKEEIMGNKFDALGNLNDEEAEKTTQGDGARDNNMGNEIGSTKKWVEEVFNGKKRIGESCSNKKVADKERLITEDKRNDIAMLNTSQTIDKDDNEEREKKDEGKKVGNIGGGSEEMERQGSSNFVEDGVNELQDLTEDKKQRRRDTKEDGEAYITVKKTIVLAMSAYRKFHQQKRSRSNQIRRGCLGISMSVSNQCEVRQKWKSMETCLHFPSNSSGLGIRSTAPPKFTTTKEAEVRKEE